MAVVGGPDEIVTDGLVLYLDVSNKDKGINPVQKITDPNFETGTKYYLTGNTYINVNYLGDLYTGSLNNGVLSLSGGDAAVYSISNPSNWGWDKGHISFAHHNWFHYNILPTDANSANDYLVECKWKFKYVSRLGSGSLNPTFMIGRAFSIYYSKNYSTAGDDWNYAYFQFNASGSSRNELSFSCSSADSAVDIDYIKCYEFSLKNDFNNILDTKYTFNFVNNVTYQNGPVNYLSSDGVDDYMVITNFPRFQPTDSVTLEAYVRLNGLPSYPHIISRGYSSSGYPSYWLRRQNTAGWSVAFSDSSSGYGVTDAEVPTLNTWYHVVGILDRNSGLVSLYVNGVLKGTKDATNIGSIENAAGNLTLMSYIQPVSYGYFPGDIAMVRIYNRALSQNEVVKHYTTIKERFTNK